MNFGMCCTIESNYVRGSYLC